MLAGVCLMALLPVPAGCADDDDELVPPPAGVPAPGDDVPSEPSAPGAPSDPSGPTDPPGADEPGGTPDDGAAGDENENDDDMETKVTLTAGGCTFSLTPADTEAARAFVARLPLTLVMDELNGNEKYHYLPDRLPTAAVRPGTIRTGDLMLYGSSCVVLFYETFSSGYSYTPLGRVDDPDGLAAALGRGSVEVTFARP